MSFLLRWLVSAIAVAAAVWLVPGIELIGGDSAWVGIVIFALILSLIDISIKPILQILSLPITVFTLGLFYLIVNTVMLYLAAWLANGLFGIGFWISNFGSAFLASIVISLVTVIVNSIVASDNRPAGGY